MSNAQPAPNGRGPIKPSMTPEQRKAWLLEHKAPAEMLLVTTLEWMIVERNLTANRTARLALQTELQGAIAALDEFGGFAGFPDLPSACRSAAFGSLRFKRVIDPAIKAAEATRDFMTALIDLVADPTVKIDLLAGRDSAAKLAEFLIIERDALTPPQPEPPKQ